MRTETVVIGAGQAGLSVGYHLKRLGRPFVILEANERVGDCWRSRWDSLRLFTPGRFNGLDGLPFPGPRHAFPTKDQMADYLEAYARHFDLPLRTDERVVGIERCAEGFSVTTSVGRHVADNVVVAMANLQSPYVPAFADQLDGDIVQLHSSEYRSPAQLRDGPVLIVGAGNSGAEIAIETARTHATWVSGRDTGQVPFDIESRLARLIVPVVFRLLFHRLLTVDTPIGRRARPKVVTHGGPLIRVKRRDLAAAGARLVPRTAGVRAGLPLLEDDRTLDVANVIWCTGFERGFRWIDLPGCGPGEPAHDRGVMHDVPGLYFVGLHFLYALSSVMIHGVGRDAGRIARHIAQRAGAPQAAAPQEAAVA